MEAAAAVRGLAAAARALPAPGRPDSDEQLLESAQAWEELGWIVDARPVAAAAEVGWRSRPQLGSDSLASRWEERSGSALLVARLRISSMEAKRRIRIGAPLVPRWSLTLEEGPARFPFVGDAVRDGRMGLDSARVILDMLQAVRRRAVPEEMAVAEAALTDSAATVSPESVAVQAQAWAMHLDPDGAEPQEELQRRQRSFRLGRVGPDGLCAIQALVLPEERAVIQAVLHDHRRGVNWTIGTDADGDEDLSLEWHEASGDERTRAQYDYDTFFAVFGAGVRAEQEGSGHSLKTPHEVITLVRADDLERRHGAGYPEGVLARFSIPTVERLQCGGSSRLLVTGGDGEPLHLGRRVRLFSPAQRKALAARDGGCAWPGCTAPIAWCDAHHIAWYHRDGGRTDLPNGVLLCNHHHHVIHSTSRWQIRLHHRQPHLVPTGWQGPPLPRHRMQQHPARLATAGPTPRM